ncbi:hypothetical protein [Sulfuriferula nivalis]|uniref:Uncharacterized protein n=1 Tax=Sulfuriferula nivalis TaxID=2675298 RepID=A0A809SD48_9PROT|nr:hypothetical protein [Sulfuriferula nivalis]BBP00327.1 hypothetical protein SFSGTM_10350 [Sulfuriferula nivalis]
MGQMHERELAVLTEEEYQQEQADKLNDELNQDQQIEKTGSLIIDFVSSYEKHKTTMALDLWLVTEFKQHKDIWSDDAEIEETAKEIIATVKSNNESKSSLYEHLDYGKSQASWVASHIEQGAKAAGVVNVGRYAGQIEATIGQANTDMARTIFTKDANISQALNLDGFIAEQHHVDTFNLEAAAQGSSYRAKALVPDGTAYGKNSMDIGIYDEKGQLVKRYQAKYGQHADATQDLWEKGDYRGQRKLVPADQVNDINGATDKIEHDGVQSKPLTKAEAKELQDKAQRHEESKTYEWNDVSRTEIAKQIGKQALVGAALTAGFHGVRVFGRRIWNDLLGKKNPPLSADLQDFFQSSVKSAAHVGVQVAVSGAIVVSAKNGWLGAVLKNSPAGRLASMAYLGMENAKVLFKFAKGEMTGEEAADAMGKTTTSLAISMASAAQGAMLGAAYGTVFGPAGTIVGGIVGGIAAGMAGSKIGEAVYEGGKNIVKTAVKAIGSTVSAVYEGVKNVSRAINPMNWL